MPCKSPGLSACRGTFAFLTLALTLIAAPGVQAEGLIVGPVEFSPSSFVPGEVVTAVALLDPGAAPWTEETVSAGFPETSEVDPHVLSATLRARRGAPLLVVRFVAWQPGPGALPNVVVGGLEIPRIRFDCGSALQDGNRAAPEPLPQLNRPGLYARLYALGGMLLVAVLGGLAVAARAAPWFKALKARRAFALVRREFDEMLTRLGTAGSGPAAWTELCAGLRRFAGLRSGTDLSAMTASEVSALPEDAIPGGAVGDIAGLLAMGDDVRFAGTLTAGLSEAVSAARSIAARVDEALLRAPAIPAELCQAGQRRITVRKAP